MVSSQPHEVAYAGKKAGKNGRARVVEAKKQLGRMTSRPKVMAKARALTGGKKAKAS